MSFALITIFGRFLVIQKITNTLKHLTNIIVLLLNPIENSGVKFMNSHKYLRKNFFRLRTSSLSKCKHITYNRLGEPPAHFVLLASYKTIRSCTLCVTLLFDVRVTFFRYIFGSIETDV